MGPDDPLWSLPTCPVLCFCDSVTGAPASAMGLSASLPCEGGERRHDKAGCGCRLRAGQAADAGPGCTAVAMATPHRPLGCHGNWRGKGLPVAPPEVPAGAGSGPEARPARREGRGASEGRKSGERTPPVSERRSRACPGRRGAGAAGPAGRGRSCPTGAQSGDTPPLPPRGPCTGRWRRREAAAAVARGRRAGPGCESRGGTGGERRRMSLLCAQYLR